MNSRILPQIILLLFSFTTPLIGSMHPGFINVKDFGARGDGKNIDSKGINSAIDKASNEGGGTVYIPAGTYLCGSIHLKSNVCLYVDQGANIIAAEVSAKNLYDEEEESISVKYQDSGHSHWKNSLIWGYDIENVSIIGQGCINGKALYKDWVKGSKMNANKAISLYRCRNVIIRDISVIHGGWFAVLATGTDNITIDNIKIDTNRDGIDIDCCMNVRISNCSVNSPYDDAICLKSSFALGYSRATEDVTITNCQVSGFDEGTLLDGTFKRSDNKTYGKQPTGRIKFGTESNGGFKNIAVTNCTFEYCRGLAIETVDGGLIEDITISNITMRDIVNAPVFLCLGSRLRGPENAVPGRLHRVSINNLIADNVNPEQGILISGIPGYIIEDIELKNIKIFYKGGGTRDQSFINVPENEKSYPEPSMFGIMPSYGTFIRHANKINLENIDFQFESPDKRPPLVFDNVSNSTIRFLTAQKDTVTSSLLIKNCNNIQLFESLGINNQTINTLETIKL